MPNGCRLNPHFNLKKRVLEHFADHRTLRVFVTQKRSRYRKHSIFFEEVENFQKKGLGRVCAPIWHISKILIAGSLVKNSEILDFGPTLKSVPAQALFGRI